MMTPQQPSLFDLHPAAWELDAAGDRLSARIVFPEAPAGVFDYLVPDGLRGTIACGARVKVPLGRGNRAAVGYCVELRSGAPGGGALKEILEVLDHPPLISAEVLRVARWIAEYYLCELGPVLETVVPAGVRARAGTREVRYYMFDAAHARTLESRGKLPEKQQEVVSYLERLAVPATLARIVQEVGCTSGPIQGLVKKGILKSELRRVFTAAVEEHLIEEEAIPTLTEEQQVALDRVLAAIASGQHRSLLLWGVTGSGKTEVYLRAIEEVVRYGRQAIVLVPEISLTPQTRRRFAARLRDVAVLHSHLSPAERHLEWQRIARGEVQVVVGARSAIFAPVKHLGLIILDEEHESTFKQETAPRYHARDVAAWRAAEAGIPLLLGTATPSLESWQRAQCGTHELLRLPKRVENRPMPHVAVIDLRAQFLDRSFRGALSRPLTAAIQQTLAEGDQVILLLNRRGFATHIQCPACGYVAKCEHCDIALTHHREGERAICHYCNYQISAPTQCPECQFRGIRFAGQGTQRLEAELRANFPKTSVLRMDTDSMQGIGSHEKALEAFRRGEFRVLVGTQMIAKGLDFPHVTLVGVVNADVGLHLPDFRAVERTFQLVTQVAGRTGRGNKGGRVLVQTMNPDHFMIQAAARHDFLAFARQELPQRLEHGYPPFAHAVRLVVRGNQERDVRGFAESLAAAVRGELARRAPEARVLGPGPAPIARLRGQSRYHLLIQIADPAAAESPPADNPRHRALREAVIAAQRELKTPKEVQWIADVDPIAML